MIIDVSVPENLTPYCSGVAAALALGQQRVRAALKDLTTEQLSAIFPGFVNSMATLVTHICATEVGCAYLLRGEPVPAHLQTEYLLDQPRSPLPTATGQTVESLTARMEAARSILLEALATISEADADKVIDFPGGRQVTVRWILGLLAHHQGQHQGQLLYLRKMVTQA